MKAEEVPYGEIDSSAGENDFSLPNDYREFVHPFGDPAFQSPGWVKVQTVGRGTEGNITVHYMRNEITGATTQYKFVTEPYVGPTRAISP